MLRTLQSHVILPTAFTWFSVSCLDFHSKCSLCVLSLQREHSAAVSASNLRDELKHDKSCLWRSVSTSKGCKNGHQVVSLWAFKEPWMKHHMAIMSWEKEVVTSFHSELPPFEQEQKSVLKTWNTSYLLEIRIFLIKSIAEIFFLTSSVPRQRMMPS